MHVTSRIVEAKPETAWAVLSDGWLYPLWVVGAARMREVDDDWPQVGSRLHHSAGSWPFLIDDTTTVLECDPPHRLVLQARGWPAGEARVTIEIVEDGQQTELRLAEDVTHGPGKLLPAPLRQLLIRVRNVEALRRLGLVVEGRAK